MTSTRLKGPGVKVLDSPIKSVSEFEQFRHSLVFYLRQDLEFRPYLKKDIKWGVKSAASPNRSLTDDPGVSRDPPTGQSAADKCEIVDFLLETVSQFCPLIPQDDIISCDSLNSLWKVIRLHNNIESTGALLNSIWSITKQPNESPQSLWTV